MATFVCSISGDTKNTAHRGRYERSCRAQQQDHEAEDIQEVEAQEERREVEKGVSVSRVLARCGIGPGDIPGWDMDALDRLPNIRLQQQPETGRYSSPWIVTDRQDLQGLPSLEAFLVGPPVYSPRSDSRHRRTT